MDCPKCGKQMESQTFKTITVDRCSGCQGLFCSPEAIEKGKDQWLADAVLDKGAATASAAYDAVDNIHCPACTVKMDKISDPEQTHIWMEACPQCKKIFLDAGEFTDLKYNTVLDRLRDWRKGERS